MIISLVAYMIVTPKSMTTEGGEFVNSNTYGLDRG